MTLAADTIEEQMRTLARQYQFALNICESLTETINNMKAAKEIDDRRHAQVVDDLKMRLTAAECRPACACGGGRCNDIHGGCQ